MRLVAVDDRVDAGVGQREVVLDHHDLLLAVDVQRSLKVAAWQDLDRGLHVATLDVDEQVPDLDSSSLWNNKRALFDRSKQSNEKLIE